MTTIYYCQIAKNPAHSQSPTRGSLDRRYGTAQRLKERGGINVAAGACLRQRDDGLLIGLFRIDERKIAHGTQFELSVRHLEARRSGAHRAAGSVQSVRIRVERMQGI